MEIKGELLKVDLEQKDAEFTLLFHCDDASITPFISQLRKETEKLRRIEIVFIDEN